MLTCGIFGKPCILVSACGCCERQYCGRRKQTLPFSVRGGPSLTFQLRFYQLAFSGDCSDLTNQAEEDLNKKWLPEIDLKMLQGKDQFWAEWVCKILQSFVSVMVPLLLLENKILWQWCSHASQSFWWRVNVLGRDNHSEVESGDAHSASKQGNQGSMT